MGFLNFIRVDGFGSGKIFRSILIGWSDEGSVRQGPGVQLCAPAHSGNALEKLQSALSFFCCFLEVKDKGDPQLAHKGEARTLSVEEARMEQCRKHMAERTSQNFY
jgi:hypothetical protein